MCNGAVVHMYGSLEKGGEDPSSGHATIVARWEVQELVAWQVCLLDKSRNI